MSKTDVCSMVHRRSRKRTSSCHCTPKAYKIKSFIYEYRREPKGKAHVHSLYHKIFRRTTKMQQVTLNTTHCSNICTLWSGRHVPCEHNATSSFAPHPRINWAKRGYSYSFSYVSELLNSYDQTFTLDDLVEITWEKAPLKKQRNLGHDCFEVL